MSAVVKVIKKAINAIVDAVIDLVESVAEALWNYILEPVLEVIVGLFGIEDEDVIETQVITQRIISEDKDVGGLITKCLLEEMRDPGVGLLDRFMGHAEVMRKRYNKYFNYGDSTFVDGLPTTNLSAIVVNTTLIKSIIDDVYGINCTIIDAELGNPTKEEFVGFWLQNNYNYLPYVNELQYSGDTFKVDQIDYDYTNNIYDVYIYSLQEVTTTVVEIVTTTITELTEDITTTTTTTTAVTITPVDEINDNKNTVVTKRIEIVGTVSGVISDTTTEISNIDELIPIGTETDSVTTDTEVEYSTDHYADNKRTVVEHRTIVEGSKEGIISDTYEIISEDDTEIAIGSEVDNTTTTTLSTETMTDVYQTALLQAPAFPLTRHYVVRYYTDDPGEWSYWVYEDGSGGYPELDDENAYVADLDMLPVITLRNSTRNVNVDKESDRYIQSKQMLKYLGIDINSLISGLEENPDIDQVEDAFVHFGLRVADNSEVVSKSLFEMFDYIYNDSGIKQDGNSYLATFTEGSFNAALGWASQSRVVTVGSIGPKGHYEHYVSGKNLVIRHQETENQYITISINDLSSVTFVDRQGLWGTVAKDVDDDGFFVPMSYYFVKSLTPLEQYAIFNKSILLSIYAAQVTHLEWYETEAFGDFLGIIGIVITIVTFGVFAPAQALLQTALMGIAISVGATLLLQMVLEATDSKFLAILAIVAFAAVSGYSSLNSLASNASNLTKSVTLFASSTSAVSNGIGTWAQIELQRLSEDYNEYMQRVEETQEELDKAREALDVAPVDVFDVVNIVNIQPINGYLEGVDALMYRARDVQFDFDRVFETTDSISSFYDSKFKLNIV